MWQINKLREGSWPAPVHKRLENDLIVVFFYLEHRGFFPYETQPSASNDFLLLPDELNVLQQCPGRILPPHLMAPLVSLLFHHQASFLVENQIVQGLGYLLD
jgi:hypothetical protein